MNFFKRNTTWSNAQLILLKLAIATAYLLLGAYFAPYVLTYKYLILFIFLFTVLPALGLWILKMKKRK